MFVDNPSTLSLRRERKEFMDFGGWVATSGPVATARHRVSGWNELWFMGDLPDLGVYTDVDNFNQNKWNRSAMVDHTSAQTIQENRP